VARPRKDSARDTRADILDAALDQFSRNGYFGSSVRDIARAVGVRESALYHHFASKEAILEALIREMGLDRVNRLTELDLTAMLGSSSPQALVRQMLIVIFAEWATERQRQMARLMLAEGPRLAEHGLINPGTVFLQVRVKVASFLTELMRIKAIRKVDPTAAAMALMAPLMLLRMAYLVMPSGPPDLKALMADLERHLDFFWKAVAPT